MTEQPRGNGDPRRTGREQPSTIEATSAAMTRLDSLKGTLTDKDAIAEVQGHIDAIQTAYDALEDSTDESGVFTTATTPEEQALKDAVEKAEKAMTRLESDLTKQETPVPTESTPETKKLSRHAQKLEDMEQLVARLRVEGVDIPQGIKDDIDTARRRGKNIEKAKKGTKTTKNRTNNEKRISRITQALEALLPSVIVDLDKKATGESADTPPAAPLKPTYGRGPEAEIVTQAIDVAAMEAAAKAAKETPEFKAAAEALQRAGMQGLHDTGPWPIAVMEAAKRPGVSVEDAAKVATQVAVDPTIEQIPTGPELANLVVAKTKKKSTKKKQSWMKRKMPRLAKFLAGITLAIGLRGDAAEAPRGSAGSTEENKATATSSQRATGEAGKIISYKDEGLTISTQIPTQEMENEATVADAGRFNTQLRKNEQAEIAKITRERDEERSRQVTRDIQAREAQKDQQKAHEQYAPTATAAGINTPEGTSDVVTSTSAEPINTDAIQSHRENISAAAAPISSEEIVSQAAAPKAEAEDLAPTEVAASFADPMSYGQGAEQAKAAPKAAEAAPAPVEKTAEAKTTTIDGTYKIKKGQGVLHAFAGLLGNGGKERVLTALMKAKGTTDAKAGEKLFNKWENEQLKNNGVNPRTLKYKRGVRIKPGDSYALAFTPEGPTIALEDKLQSEQRELGEVSRTHIVKKGETPIGVIDGFLEDATTLKTIIDWERTHNHATDTDEKIAKKWRNKQLKDNGFSVTKGPKDNPKFTPGMHVELRTDNEGKLGVFVSITDAPKEKEAPAAQEATPEVAETVAEGEVQFGGETYQVGEKVVYKTKAGAWKQYTVSDGAVPGSIQLWSTDTIKSGARSAKKFAVGEAQKDNIVRGEFMDGMIAEDLGADEFRLHVYRSSEYNAVQALATLIVREDYSDDPNQYEAAYEQAQKLVDAAKDIPDTNDPMKAHDKVPENPLDINVLKDDTGDWQIVSMTHIK